MSARAASAQAGFTLLEIMLVLLIVAVMAGMVVPNLFQSSGGRAEDIARHLQQRLRLAASEAVLTGVSVRWTAYADGYRFDQPDAEGEWLPMTERPFEALTLPANVSIYEVRMQGLDSSVDHVRDDDRPVLGRLLLMPDGMLTQADIVLSVAGANDRLIHVRPGPGGIRLVVEE
ncbi:MAG: GspH/FimT family pseudopilin [Mariprofundaceae bacterium]